jgi:hypothetical protein
MPDLAVELRELPYAWVAFALFSFIGAASFLPNVLGNKSDNWAWKAYWIAMLAIFGPMFWLSDLVAAYLYFLVIGAGQRNFLLGLIFAMALISVSYIFLPARGAYVLVRFWFNRTNT